MQWIPAYAGMTEEEVLDPPSTEGFGTDRQDQDKMFYVLTKERFLLKIFL